MNDLTIKTEADGFRPLGQILRDLKEVEGQILTANQRRERLIEELETLGDAAKRYAEEAA